MAVTTFVGRSRSLAVGIAAATTLAMLIRPSPDAPSRDPELDEVLAKLAQLARRPAPVVMPSAAFTCDDRTGECIHRLEVPEVDIVRGPLPPDRLRGSRFRYQLESSIVALDGAAGFLHPAERAWCAYEIGVRGHCLPTLAACQRARTESMTRCREAH